MEVKDYPTTGICGVLGNVAKEDRFYIEIEGQEHAVVFGESTLGPIPAKRKSLVGCPLRRKGDGIFACGDCGLYLAKKRLNP